MYPYFSIKKPIPRPLYAKELSKNDDLTNQVNSKLSDIITICMENKQKSLSFYEELFCIIDQKDKSIINSITLDETKHYKLLHCIYTLLNDSDPEKTDTEKAVVSENISENIETAILEKAENTKLYRELMSSAFAAEIREMLFEIMTDEMNHAILLNYLYTKYR